MTLVYVHIHTSDYVALWYSVCVENEGLDPTRLHESITTVQREHPDPNLEEKLPHTPYCSVCVGALTLQGPVT